jgi:hypothetical protein
MLVRTARRVQPRSLTCSSMIPIDGATCLSDASSAHDSSPGLRCGSRPVSSMTRIATARRYSMVEA